MTRRQRKWLIRGALVVIAGVLAAGVWQRYFARDKEEGLASGNGRIEATEFDVAAKMPGRVKEIAVREGDFVEAGQVVALMDTEVLEAQLREAGAQLRQAQSAVATARSQVVQRESEKAAALAVVGQREAEFSVAQKSLARSSALAAEGATSQQEADNDRARVESAVAATVAARAQVAAAEAVIVTAREQIAGAESAVKAAQATVERIQADIKDSALKSPCGGRVQYLVARAGEVVAAGGRVLNLVDLSDVYMTFFLPTAEAGRVALGAEVRLVLDAAPGYVIPARVSFVADVAQFTPKAVETTQEREKLMFRIRAQILPELLLKHLPQVKTGLPGMAYVRLDPKAEWPSRLRTDILK